MKPNKAAHCVYFQLNLFFQKEIRYLIPPTLNTHIDCIKNSKSMFGAFSKQQQGALKACFASLSVKPQPPVAADKLGEKAGVGAHPNEDETPEVDEDDDMAVPSTKSNHFCQDGEVRCE